MRVVGADSGQMACAQFLVPSLEDFRVVIGARPKKFVRILPEILDDLLPCRGIRGRRQHVTLETGIQPGIRVAVADFHSDKTVTGNVVTLFHM